VPRWRRESAALAAHEWRKPPAEIMRPSRSRKKKCAQPPRDFAHGFASTAHEFFVYRKVRYTRHRHKNFVYRKVRYTPHRHEFSRIQKPDTHTTAAAKISCIQKFATRRTAALPSPLAALPTAGTPRAALLYVGETPAFPEASPRPANVGQPFWLSPVHNAIAG
jgi:hypothetical protein